jgi:HSP20 family molecular chaperone IbpA
MLRKLSVVLSFVAAVSAAVPGRAHSQAPAVAPVIRVQVRETADEAVLRIRVPASVAPDSVDVVVNGRQVVVLARDLEGRELRSRLIRLRAPVVEEGAEADYEGSRWFVVRLRRAAPDA